MVAVQRHQWSVHFDKAAIKWICSGVGAWFNQACYLRIWVIKVIDKGNKIKLIRASSLDR
jgi:hypothetical protein